MSDMTNSPRDQDPFNSASATPVGLLARVVRYWRGGAAIQPERPFDPGQRPAGWIGHWSEHYGRVLSRALTQNPPFDRPVRVVLADAPRPLQEALDPVVSVAEPQDRDGRKLAWRWDRSLTADLLGPIGVVLGSLTLAAVLFSTAVDLLDLPPVWSTGKAVQDRAGGGDKALDRLPQEQPPQRQTRSLEVQRSIQHAPRDSVDTKPRN